MIDPFDAGGSGRCRSGSKLDGFASKDQRCQAPAGIVHVTCVAERRLYTRVSFLLAVAAIGPTGECLHSARNRSEDWDCAR